MVLSHDRIGQIALQALQHKMEGEGIRLNPKEVKRQIHNEAKTLGITVSELAEFAKLIYRTAFNKTMAELEAISPSSSRSEESEKTLDRMMGEHNFPQTKVEEKEQLPPGGFLKK